MFITYYLYPACDTMLVKEKTVVLALQKMALTLYLAVGSNTSEFISGIGTTTHKGFLAVGLIIMECIRGKHANVLFIQLIE